MNINRTGTLARAAQATSMWKRCSFMNSREQRGNDGANRPRIDPAIGMSADVLVDWTGIQTSSATYTSQGFDVVAGVDTAPTIIEQDEIDMLWPVRIRWTF